MKRLILALVLVGTFLAGGLLGGFFLWAASPPGKYQSQIDDCLALRKKHQALSQEDYICPQDPTISNQDVAYQVILDIEMRKIDKQIRAELVQLQSQQTKDVVALQQKVSAWFDKTSSPKGKYANAYAGICHDLGDEKNPINAYILQFGSATINNKTSYFLQNNNACEALVSRKITAYRKIASLVIMDDVSGSYVSDRTNYTGKLKNEYQTFLEQWRSYITGLGVIADKWLPNGKTKITQ